MRERGKCSSLHPFHCITGNSIFLSKGFSSTEIKRHIFCKIHENIRPTRKWNWVGGRDKKKEEKPFATFPAYTSLPPHLFNIYALRYREKFVYFSSVCALCTLNQYFHTWEVKGLGCSAKHTVGLKERIIISVSYTIAGASCDVTSTEYNQVQLISTRSYFGAVLQ